MRIYTVRKEFIDDCVKREASKKILVPFFSFLSLLIATFAFTYYYGAHLFMMPPLIIISLLVLAATHNMSTLRIRNMTELTHFVFTDDSISRLLDKEKLKLMTKVFVSKNENLDGFRYNQTIKLNEIEFTTISANEIVIKSKHYDFFTSNGKITIPKEMENYDSIKSEIIENSKRFKLK